MKPDPDKSPHHNRELFHNELDKYPIRWGWKLYPKDNRSHFWVAAYQSDALRSLCGKIVSLSRVADNNDGMPCHLCTKIARHNGLSTE